MDAFEITQTTALIMLVIGVINLIVFWLMASNIAGLRNMVQEIRDENREARNTTKIKPQLSNSEASENDNDEKLNKLIEKMQKEKS